MYLLLIESCSFKSNVEIDLLRHGSCSRESTSTAATRGGSTSTASISSSTSSVAGRVVVLVAVGVSVSLSTGKIPLSTLTIRGSSTIRIDNSS